MPLHVVEGQNPIPMPDQMERLTNMLEYTNQVSQFSLSIKDVQNDILTWNHAFQEFEQETLFKFFSKQKTVFIHGLPWWHRFLRFSSDESFVFTYCNSLELQNFINYFGNSNEMSMYGKSWIFSLYDHLFESTSDHRWIENLIEKYPYLQKTLFKFMISINPSIRWKNSTPRIEYLTSNILNLGGLFEKTFLSSPDNAPDTTPDNAIEYLVFMLKNKDSFQPQEFSRIYDIFCKTCDDVYYVTTKINPNQSTDLQKSKINPNQSDISSNIMFLHSILGDKLLVELCSKKSKANGPLYGKIKQYPWLTHIIEVEMTTVLSYLFKNSRNDIINLVTTQNNASNQISTKLITLLLDNTDNFRMLRREFFLILTDHFDNAEDAIKCIKIYSTNTSVVVKKATEEIKGQYGYTKVEKGLLFLSLFLSFILGSAFYGFDVGADIKLLNESGKCNMSQPCSNTTHLTENATFQILSPCYNGSIPRSNNPIETEFNCALTLCSVPKYWSFTLVAVLIPILLNLCLMAIEWYRNGWDSIIMLPCTLTKCYYPYNYPLCCLSHESFAFFVVRARPFKTTLNCRNK